MPMSFSANDLMMNQVPFVRATSAGKSCPVLARRPAVVRRVPVARRVRADVAARPQGAAPANSPPRRRRAPLPGLGPGRIERASLAARAEDIGQLDPGLCAAVRVVRRPAANELA
ncbi:MAG TPA: hypothetical protein VG122_18610, partial [Gemmata sp.]|nr:hypothetical protein [Gemmata sp.]